MLFFVRNLIELEVLMWCKKFYVLNGELGEYFYDSVYVLKIEFVYIIIYV